MVRHPATYWAKYYLSGRGNSYEEVKNLLEVIDLPGMEVEDLEELDNAMEYPRLFRPHLRSDRRSQQFLRRERIYEAWHPDSDMKLAGSIIEDESLRQHVETMLLSPIKAEQAVKKLRSSLGVEINIRAYELFRHYFWNTELLTGLEWGRFIQQRRSANQEWLSLAVDARGPEGVQLLLWKTGMSGLTKIESNRGFARAKNASFMFLEQIMMNEPSEGHSKMWLNYLRAAKLAQEGEDASANAVKDIVEAFKSFRLKTKAVATPSVKQLTGGNFSPAEVSDSDDEGLKY